MKKNIISVGFSVPASRVSAIDFDSNQSLLDADIVIFDPDISEHTDVSDFHQGKPCLHDPESFHLQELCTKWCRELRACLEAGGTVFWFLSRKIEVYVDTGRKEYSGTGRNRLTTTYVEPFDNYTCIPVQLGVIVPARGTVIIPCKNLGPMSSYWMDFGGLSEYQCYIDAQPDGSLLVTKTGKKTVGGIFPVHQGWLVVLPPLRLDRMFRTPSGAWNAKAKKIGPRLIQHMVAIDESLRVGAARTPAPEWTSSLEYELDEAVEIRQELDRINSEMVGLAGKLSEKSDLLEQVNAAKFLLYEQGNLLESAILDCLRLLGFDAKPYKDGDSEFDAVFEAPEGRMLGEAEGKDKSAVNIDKLSQLERNISEDFQRDGVQEHAKGVLFGNAFRLLPPHERGDFFTEKCRKGAKRAAIALIRTPDLFPVMRYLKRHPSDESYKKLCREAIADTSGEVVIFPVPPTPRKVSA